MTRAAMLAALIVGIALQPAAAADYHREDLRIPMEAAGPCGLEAMLLRPGLRRLAKGSFAFRSGRRVKRRRRPSPPARNALPIAR